MTNKTKPAKWQGDNLFLRGFSLYKAGKFKEAADHFRMVTLLAPTEGRYWISLGHALRRAGQLEEAIDTYKAAILLGQSEDPEMLLSLAECYKDTGQDDEAMVTLEEASLFADKELHYRLDLIKKNWSNKD